MASTVTVDFNANLTRFSSSIDKATNDLNKFQANTARIAGNIKSAFAILGTGFAVAGLTNAIRDVAEFADEMGKAAQKVGTTTEALSGLKYAGDLADVAFEQLQTGLAKLAKNAEDFRDGNKSAVEAFAKIGVDPSKFNDTTELFSAVADGLSKIESGSRKAAIAQELFGKSGAQLIPLLNAGSDGLKQAAEEAERFGQIISTDAAQAAEEFNDNLTRIGKAVDGLKISLGSGVIRDLADFTTQMLAAAQAADGFWGALAGFNTNKRDVGADLKEAQDRLAGLKKLREELDPKKSFSNSLNEAIFGDVKTLDAQIKVAQQEVNTLVKLKKQLETKPASAPIVPVAPGATSSSSKAKKSSGKSDAEIAAEETAKLIKQFQDATAPAQTLSEKLQAQLDTYRALNPQVRDYLQGLVDQAKASEATAKAMEDAAYWQEIMADSIDREIDAFNEAEEAQKSFEQSIQDYVDSVERAADPTLELADNIGKLQSALSLGLIDQETFDRLSKFVTENEKGTDRITEFWKEAARNIQDAMSDLFFDAMQGELGDLEQSFKRTIDRMVANLLAAQLTDRLFGADFGKDGTLGSDSLIQKGVDWFSGLFNANGNAFNQSGLIPFANGGIVSSAVPFSFGGSKLGVMGEAGPEAILPLKRGSNGQLGVQMNGGTPSYVNIYVTTPDANSFRKSQPQIMADMQRSLNRGRRVV
jgi:HAMP domain-containing protein